MYSPPGYPRCRWVCFFIKTDLEKISITSLAHQWILFSEWVPSGWEFCIHNTAFSSEKVISPESGEKSAQIKHSLQVKTVLNKYLGGFWCERTTSDFFIGGSVIMDYGLVFWPEAVVWSFNVLMMDLFLTNTQLFTSQDVNWWTGLEWCGLLWCFYQLFGLSFWRHPFTAEDPLMSKWCKLMLNFSCSCAAFWKSWNK